MGSVLQKKGIERAPSDSMKKSMSGMEQGLESIVTINDIKEQRFPYTLRCIHEAMRLYPQPPVYTRRSVIDNTIQTQDGKEYSIRAGDDMLISIYNMHRSESVWERPNDFYPERFSMDEPP